MRLFPKSDGPNMDGLCGDGLHAGQGLEHLESRQLMAADLSIAMGAIRMDNSGDEAKVAAIVTNAGDVRSAEGARVAFFLSADNVLDDADRAVGEVRRLSRLNPGQSKSVKLETKLSRLLNPASANPMTPGSYYVFAKVLQDTPDANPANDSAVAASTVSLSNNEFGEHHRREVTVSFASGDITFSLQGPGSGSATTDADGHILVTITGTTEQSSLRIVGPRTTSVAPSVYSLDIQGSLRKLKVDRVNLTGTLAVSGGIREVEASSLQGLAANVGGSSASEWKLGAVLDSSITSAAPIKELSVRSWLDSDATPDAISTTWIGKVQAKADFGASVLLSGRIDLKPSLAKIEVKGAMSGDLIVAGDVGEVQAGSVLTSRMMVSGSLAKLNIKSGVDQSTVAAANIRSVNVQGSVTDSHIAAGAMFIASDIPGLFAGSTALSWAGGNITELRIGVDAVRSTFTAAVDPHAGAWLDDDDRFALDSGGGALPGSFTRITVKGSLTDSKFAAPTMPASARIGGLSVPTAGDPRFLTSLG